jgi:threonine synthase
MQYYSTNNPSHKVSLKEAVLKGLAPDNGLYMPSNIPRLDKNFFSQSRNMNFIEIGECVIKSLFSEDLTGNKIDELASHTLSFDAPIIKLSDRMFSLELFHGPTLAFKDFGARFCSKLISFLIQDEYEKVRVLVATSGDTGSAVANGFLDIPGIEVVILYPKGKVSEIQEKQFTTLGRNTISLEVDGTFDDCQRLVKEAFLDSELQERMTLTSANSINIARWMPQSLYYFYSWSRLPDNGKKTVYAVPSGNFGNLGAGILAAGMGLPVDMFIAATNVNNVVPRYLAGETFTPERSIQTISNSMDVGNPSNFPRLVSLYDSEEELRSYVKGYFYTDDETRETMRKVYRNTSYVLDPHGAVGCAAVHDFLKDNSNYQGVFLETAHPVKFKSVVEETLDVFIEIPERLKVLLEGERKVTSMTASYTDFKEFLLN